MNTTHPALRRAIIAARSAPVRVQPMAVIVEPAPIVALPAQDEPDPTPEAAFRVTWYSLPELESFEPPVAKIKRAVSAATGIRIVDMMSNRRIAQVVEARQITMYLCRILTRNSFPAIGRLVGDLDNSTVRHGIKKIEARIAVDPEFAAKVEAIREIIEQEGKS